MSKIVKSMQSCSNGRHSYHCFFIALRARSMNDLVCEFTCAVAMRSSNGRERP